MHLTLEFAYDAAVMLLSKAYGNAHSLLAFYSNRIKSVALIKPSYVMDFSKFFIFILKCETTPKTTN